MDKILISTLFIAIAFIIFEICLLAKLHFSRKSSFLLIQMFASRILRETSALGEEMQNYPQIDKYLSQSLLLLSSSFREPKRVKYSDVSEMPSESISSLMEEVEQAPENLRFCVYAQSLIFDDLLRLTCFLRPRYSKD